MSDPVGLHKGPMTITDAINKFVGYGDIPAELASKIAKNLESKFGSNIGQYLGAGGKGFAWKWGHNWVFKLTTDEQEASAASILLGKKHPHVGQYRNVANIDGTKLYAIIQEYAGEPIKDVDIQKAINLMPGSSDAIINTLKELTETSSFPLWPQLLSAIQWLKHNGINHFDLHSDNVVQRGEVFKVIDVGIGDVEPMHLGRIKLEQRLAIAFSNIETITI
jgi:serine/threonine protein kinase